MTTDVLARRHLDAESAASADTAALLRPALLARYLDVANLRHDFPIVLGADDDHPVATLTGIVNELLATIAPAGAAGERMRQHVLRLETAMRRRLERDPRRPTLAQAWERAVDDLLGEAADAEALQASLAIARSALRADGLLLACDDDAPAAVVRHLREVVERPRAAAHQNELAELTRRLAAVLDVDERQSADGRSPARLRAAVGAAHEDDFDFDAWSEILATRPHDGRLPEARRTRIEWALSVLRSQRFVATDADPGDRLAFEFDSCARALSAYQERVPELARLVKATAIARLELDNAYDEAVHGAFFHAFDASALHPDDLLPFPGYLIVLDGDELDPAARAQVLDLLASPLPFKILVLTADAVGPPPLRDPLGPRRLTGVELTAAALGLGTARLVQTAGAGLARSSDAVQAALADRGPALISVVTATVQAGPGMPAYLASAAAAEARAVPVLSYDPRGGPDGSSRLMLSHNAQAARDWPVHPLAYEDERLQRIEEETAFTVADLVAADPRFADHVEVAPRSAWTDAMVPVADYLRVSESERRGRVPYVVAVGEDDVLRRVVVDHRVVAATEEVLAAWRRLRELSGVRDREERRHLAEEPAALEVERTATADVPDVQPPEPALEDAADTPSAEVSDDGPAPGEAWIETARCTTCDECTNLNPRMFAYNGEKQAYIADLHAGTFRELVQAAETCQVAIIHPGDPWDPNESGLDDLRRRAVAFA